MAEREDRIYPRGAGDGDERTVSAKRSHVDQVLSTQENVVAELHSTIEVLYKKLARVLRNEEKGEGDAKEKELSPYVDLATDIDRNNKSILHAVRKVGDIIDRLEL